MENYINEVNRLVENGTNNIKKKVVILNDDKPIFNKKDFDIIEGTPKYFGVDKYGRVMGAIALLSKNTIPKITEKELEYPRPYGWTKNLEKVKKLFESCHIIAYNLSAQSTDKENLFIGTNDLNRSIMKHIENKVNDYIKNNDYNVLYKVTIKYKGTDKIPTGILIEAKSIDGELNICQFCYNVERYIKFDYKDGSVIYNHDYLNKIKVKLKNIKERTKKDKTQQAVNKKIIITKRNYILNIITNECHYDKDCEKLRNVEPKHIQGTRTTEQVILDNDFKMCNKCRKEYK